MTACGMFLPRMKSSRLGISLYDASQIAAKFFIARVSSGLENSIENMAEVDGLA